MRYFYFCFFIVLSHVVFAQLKLETGCNSQRAFGDLSICLPNFSGMVECYADSRVKKHVDEARYDGNEIIGMYFTDSTYDRADELGEFSYDNYFKVYAPNDLKDLTVSAGDVDQMQEILRGIYNQKNWEEMKAEIEDGFDYLSLEQPVLIKTHKSSANHRNMVFLMSVISQYETVDLVMTINIIRIKNRMLFFAYYKRFKGEESIEFALNQSRIFGESLISVND